MVGLRVRVIAESGGEVEAASSCSDALDPLGILVSTTGDKEVHNKCVQEFSVGWSGEPGEGGSGELLEGCIGGNEQCAG